MKQKGLAQYAWKRLLSLLNAATRDRRVFTYQSMTYMSHLDIFVDNRISRHIYHGPVQGMEGFHFGGANEIFLERHVA
jgi:hypothetical protein